jgi:2-polyprenyl-6-methoxyphenol hydroxylase-like FAD-dependent oxidoreductase
MNRRILISGASVAGPALAFWLTKYGFEVTVVERAPFVRLGGYAVDFRGSAMGVLQRMGLLEAVKQHETRTGSITMVNAKNKVVARLPDGFTSGDLEIPRGDLAKILYEATRNSAEYIFDDSIRSMTQVAEEIEVTFATGKVRRFDLVVGADGLHSNVRAIAFGEESKFVKHLGYYIAIFTVPDFLHLVDTARFYVEPGRRAGCFGTKNNGKAHASFYFASEKVDYGKHDAALQKKLLLETFANMKWETSRMLEMMDAAPDFYFDSLSQVKMTAWSAGRVVLLGDAAGCATPLSGMGTSLAIIGAYVLAGELLAAGNDYALAFTKYEAAMRSCVNEAQKMAAESVGWFIPKTKLKVWLSRKLWSWTPQSTLKELMVEQPRKIANMVDIKDYS